MFQGWRGGLQNRLGGFDSQPSLPYASLAQWESSSLWGSNSIGRKRECKFESCLLHHKLLVASSNLARRTISSSSSVGRTLHLGREISIKD